MTTTTATAGGASSPSETTTHEDSTYAEAFAVPPRDASNITGVSEGGAAPSMRLVRVEDEHERDSTVPSLSPVSGGHRDTARMDPLPVSSPSISSLSPHGEGSDERGELDATERGMVCSLENGSSGWEGPLRDWFVHMETVHRLTVV